MLQQPPENGSRSPSPKRFSPLVLALIGFGLVAMLVGAGALAYSVPSVRARVDDAVFWRVQTIRTAWRDLVNPPQEFLPTPVSVADQSGPIAPVLNPDFEDSAPDTPPTSTPIPTATTEVLPSATPIPTPAPLPLEIQLTGIVHEYQRFNNCGPATISMAMSYWGFTGDQEDTASWLKPRQADVNVRPSEIEYYTNTVQGHWLGAVYRVGGTTELLQTLIAAGYPVIVEKGMTVEDIGWMGHYLPLTGYDSTQQLFFAQDSYYGPDRSISFEELDTHWQHFNRTFIVVYPIEREDDLLALLGDYANLTDSYNIALAQSEAELAANPQDAFALHNLGTTHNYFGDSAAAAEAYDQAREIGLPWRMLWYQTGIYRAYYNVGRYQEVIELANLTLSNMTEPNHEESLYWRGWAYHAQGNLANAISDFQRALHYNHNFTDARTALDQISQ